MLDPAAAILHALAATGRDACPRAAERIAREIATYGDIDRAAAALANDEAQVVLSDLLSYRAALAERADPARCIARLRQDAADLDARADPLWAQAAQFAGRASFRRLQGETDLADLFQRKVRAAEQAAMDLEAQAFARRLQAAQLEAAAARGAHLQAALKTIAA